MSHRKYIRIGLSEDDAAKLALAKTKVEEQTGIHMTDSLFVLSLLRKAIAN
jgi:hypothetical protein